LKITGVPIHYYRCQYLATLYLVTDSNFCNFCTLVIMRPVLKETDYTNYAVSVTQ